MEKLKTFLKWRWIRVLQVWNRAPIRAQGGIWVLIPAVALFISFLTAIYGNLSRASIEYDIQRKFKAVRQYNDLLTLMIDAETGERGVLLTKRQEFLEPYQKAISEIPNTITNLNETIQAEPGEKPRQERIGNLAKIQDLINRQLASLKKSQDFVAAPKSDEELYQHLNGGKSLMDEIRGRIGEMQNEEERLFTERVEEINSIRNRDYIVIFISLGIGLLARLVSFYLFERGIVRRIHRLTENVCAINNEKSLRYPFSKKNDAIGLLEEEIAKIAEQKNLEIKSK